MHCESNQKVEMSFLPRNSNFPGSSPMSIFERKSRERENYLRILECISREKNDAMMI